MKEETGALGWGVSILLAIICMSLWSENNSKTARIAALSSALSELHDLVISFESKLSEARSEFDSVKSSSDDLRSHVDSFGDDEDWRDVVSDVESDTSDLESRIRNLDDSIEELEANLSEILEQSAPVEIDDVDFDGGYDD